MTQSNHGGLKAADAVVIGGGFYGAVIAAYLRSSRRLSEVLLVEREASLLTRASYNNQARVHNGYHYPRSFTTAFRSRVNMPRFVSDWITAVRRDFLKIYAIARRNSGVTATQFNRFCGEIGARIQPAPASLKRLFDGRLVEDVFVVEEYAFDASVLGREVSRQLDQAGVHTRLESRVTEVYRDGDRGLRVTIADARGNSDSVSTRYVFNCTYSGLNQLTGAFPGTRTSLKHEIAELALIRVPPVFRDAGVTVMDGQFFSCMPFPARGLHTLSHVRYTPHMHWTDAPRTDPYERLHRYDAASRFDRMLRDAVRYVPGLKDSVYEDSLFEVKTVLLNNERDDGRPILFETYAELPGFYSILGGKIDNIYDVLQKLDSEVLTDEPLLAGSVRSATHE